jgi:uncharacterized protein
LKGEPRIFGSEEDLPRDNPAASRFELLHDGQVSTLSYRRRPGHVSLVHTEVPVVQRGQGLGTRLIDHALAAARDAGERVVPICPFARAYLESHPPS